MPVFGGAAAPIGATVAFAMMSRVSGSSTASSPVFVRAILPRITTTSMSSSLSVPPMIAVDSSTSTVSSTSTANTSPRFINTRAVLSCIVISTIRLSLSSPPEKDNCLFIRTLPALSSTLSVAVSLSTTTNLTASKIVQVLFGRHPRIQRDGHSGLDPREAQIERRHLERVVGVFLD